jgi:CRP/FNR family cyclic AMP-dependent transcriptional regulator
VPRRWTSAAPAGTRLPLPPHGGGTWIHLVEAGLVRPVAVTDEGREFGLGLLGPGEAFVQQDDRSGSPAIGLQVEAVEDARCTGYQRRDLAEVAAQEPATAARLLDALCARAVDLGDLAASLSLQDGTERLARLLSELARRHGTPDGPAVRLRLRQQDLGAMAGLCRESVNAALRRLAAAGRVRVARQTLWVLPETAPAAPGPEVP